MEQNVYFLSIWLRVVRDLSYAVAWKDRDNMYIVPTRKSEFEIRLEMKHWEKVIWEERDDERRLLQEDAISGNS